MKFRFLFFAFTAYYLLLSACGIYAFQSQLTEHRFYNAVDSNGAGKIYFIKHKTGYNWDLGIMNEDGTNQTLITDDALMERNGDVFPDKSKLAVVKTADSGSYIYTMNIDGTNPKSIYSTTEAIETIKVSPDGAKIAFVETDPSVSGYGTLCLINPDGTGAETLAPYVLSAISKKAPSFVPTVGSTATRNNVQGEMIAFSTDSAQIVFRDKNNCLAKIFTDGTGLTLITTYYIDNGPCWLKINKIAFTITDFTTYPNTRELAAINPDGTGYTVLYSTTGVIGNFSVSPDGTEIAVNLNNKTIAIISTAGALLNEIPLSGDYDWENEFIPHWVSGTKLLLNTADFKDIFTIKTDGTGLTNLTNNDLNGVVSLTDAKGGKILYKTGRKTFSMNTDGSNPVLLLTETADQKMNSVFLSPDGAKLLYSLQEGSSYYLYVKNSDGSGAPVKIEQSQNSFSFKWSPDGTKIIYSDDYVSSYIANSDGTGKKQIKFSEFSQIISPVFSPDSSRIAFTGFDIYYNYNLCTAPVDISTYTVILTTTVYYNICDWKSGKMLLLGNSNLYSVNSDGSGLKFIDNSYNPANGLSPDGTKLLYGGGDGKLYVIGTDGTGKTKLADTSMGWAWSTDSQKIAYIVENTGMMLGRIYLANADGSGAYNINPFLQIAEAPLIFVSGNKIVYDGDLDIWSGDYDASVYPKPEVQHQGEIKIIGGTESRGTVNPDKGENVKIDFKGSSVGKFECRIFTLTGELVYSQTKENMSSGRFEWIPKDIASGIYVVSVKGPGVSVHKKVAILR